MHRMQSGGWPYSEVGRDSSKAPSLRVAVLRTAVFRSSIMHATAKNYLVQITTVQVTVVSGFIEQVGSMINHYL